MAKNKGSITPFLRFLFLVYCGVMLWLLFGRSNGWAADIPYRIQLQQNTNLIPFYTLKNYWYTLINTQDRYMLVHCFINLAGNVILFIPAGWLLPRLWVKMRNFFRFFCLCTVAICLVEIGQLFSLLGRCDIDDLILNVAGMCAGFIIWTLGRRS